MTGCGVEQNEGLLMGGCVSCGGSVNASVCGDYCEMGEKYFHNCGKLGF